MSRSTPLLPFTPAAKAVPVVNLPTPPPEGCRWLAVGEKIEPGDQWVSAIYGQRDASDLAIGQRMHKRDVGHFARPLVAQVKPGMFDHLKPKK